MGLARSDEQAAIGAERDGLGPHAGQLNLNPRGGEDLVGWRVVTVRPDLANVVSG